MQMKFFSVVFIALVFCCTACKKNNKDDDKKLTVVGYWQGSYGLGTDVPTLPYSLLFRSNGTVRVYADNADTASAAKAEGTYIVTEAKVKTTYTFLSPGNSFSSAADIDAGFTTMDGTWGTNASTSGRGTFRVFKQ